MGLLCDKCGGGLRNDSVVCDKCLTKTEIANIEDKSDSVSPMSEVKFESIAERFLNENALPLRRQSKKSRGKISFIIFLVAVICVVGIIAGIKIIEKKEADAKRIKAELESAAEEIRQERATREILVVINDYLSAVNAFDAEKAASFYPVSAARNISNMENIIALLPWENLSVNLLSLIDELSGDGSISIEAVRVNTTFIDEYNAVSEVKIKSSILFNMIYEEDAALINFQKIENNWYILQ